MNPCTKKWAKTIYTNILTIVTIKYNYVIEYIFLKCGLNNSL